MTYSQPIQQQPTEQPESSKLVPVRPDTSDVIVAPYHRCEFPICANEGLKRTIFYGQAGTAVLWLCDRHYETVLAVVWANEKTGVWL